MKRILAAAALLPLLTLGACGDTMGDRALSGGGIGAGAVTTRDQVNMGQPVWRQGNNQNYYQGYQGQNYQN